jgi:hypothetical protein
MRHCQSLGSSHSDCEAVFDVNLWMNTEVAGFTRKTGVFFAYGVDGPEFPPALYAASQIPLKSKLSDSPFTFVPSPINIHSLSVILCLGIIHPSRSLHL